MKRTVAEVVVEALEATAVVNSSRRGKHDRGAANRWDVINHRDMLLRFLNELDPEDTVEEVRLALEEYEG